MLDNNGYIVTSTEDVDNNLIGQFLGDIRPDIMDHLVEVSVYKRTRIFDYQGTCKILPPKPSRGFVLQSVSS